MGTEHRHALPGIGDPAFRIQRPEFDQQRPGGGQRTGGWLVLKRQIGRQGAPGSTVQRQGGQFRLQNLWPVERRQAAMQRGRPESDRHARRLPPCPSGALIGRGAGNAQGGQPGQARGGIEAGGPAPAAIDHDAHAGHGQRGFGDRGGQHDSPSLGRTQGAVLLGQREIAVQWQHQRATAIQRGFGAADFAHAGQEGQDIALVLGQRLAHRGGHCGGQVAHRGDVALGLADFHREHPPQAFHGLRVHQFRQPCLIRGGRHCQQAQFRAQFALQFQAEGQRQIRFERAFMHLVQDYRRHAFQAGIGLQPADQQPLGDHLDPRCGGYGAVQAGAETNGGADGFVEQRRHPGGRRTGGETARFQHQDAAIAAPIGIQQGEWDESCLAGAGRCHQYSVAARIQRGAQGGKCIGDG